MIKSCLVIMKYYAGAGLLIDAGEAKVVHTRQTVIYPFLVVYDARRPRSRARGLIYESIYLYEQKPWSTTSPFDIFIVDDFSFILDSNWCSFCKTFVTSKTYA